MKNIKIEFSSSEIHDILVQYVKHTLSTKLGLNPEKLKNTFTSQAVVLDGLLQSITITYPLE